MHNLVGFDQYNNPCIIAIDESLLTHDEFNQVLVVDGVDSCLKKIFLDNHKNKKCR